MKNAFLTLLLLGLLAGSFPARGGRDEDEEDEKEKPPATLCLAALIKAQTAGKLLEYLRTQAGTNKPALRKPRMAELKAYAERHGLSPEAFQDGLAQMALELVEIAGAKPAPKAPLPPKTRIPKSGISEKLIAALETASTEFKGGSGTVNLVVPRNWLERLKETSAYPFFENHPRVEEVSKSVPAGESFVEGEIVPPALVRAIILVQLRPLTQKYSRDHQIKAYAEDRSVDEEPDLVKIRFRMPFDNGAMAKLAGKVGTNKEILARAILRYGLETLEGTTGNDLL